VSCNKFSHFRQKILSLQAKTLRPTQRAKMFKCSCLIALLLLSAADALRGGGGAITGGSLVLKSGTQPVTPRSVVVLRGGGA
jgi:hypothetical protein